jgi:hypothetical protein
MPDDMVLTFDTDWVSQALLDCSLRLLEAAGVKATIFCTGPYDLGSSGLFEAGLHPNFLPDSTQGDSPEATMLFLRSLYPEAVGSRSHKYYWHSGIRPLLLRHDVTYDCSLLLIQQPHLRVYDHLGLKRIATWWSDNIHLLHKEDFTRFDLPGLHEPGIKVLDFHPIHVALNTPSLEWYRKVMSTLPPVSELTGEIVDAVRHDGFGVATLLASVAERIVAGQGSGLTLREVVKGGEDKKRYI